MTQPAPGVLKWSPFWELSSSAVVSCKARLLIWNQDKIPYQLVAKTVSGSKNGVQFHNSVNISTRPLFLKWKCHRQTINCDCHYTMIKFQQASEQAYCIETIIITKWNTWKANCCLRNQTHGLALHVFQWQATLMASFFLAIPVPW